MQDFSYFYRMYFYPILFFKSKIFEMLKLYAILQIYLVLSINGQIFFDDIDLGFLNTRPNKQETYNIGNLVNQLNLQYCSVVEVGEGFCSLFVEFRSNLKSLMVNQNSVAEVYLGHCQCSVLRSWQYCSKKLQDVKPDDCTFREATSNSTARVHRRLCDLTSMGQWNADCNCSHEFAGQQLYPVSGFKTCFRSPLPESICSPRSVCGVAQCATKTLFQIHMVQCDPDCKGGLPFCEENGPETTKFRTINSIWTPWSKTICNETSKFFESESLCVDSDTKTPAFDCLGPGIYCCPLRFSQCRCEVSSGDVLRVKRLLFPCMNQVDDLSDPIFRHQFDKGIINQFFVKSNKRKRRDDDTKNYSSQWEVPKECHLLDNANKSKCHNPEIHSQQNWELYESRNSDPWNEMLHAEHDKQDKVVKSSLNRSMFNYEISSTTIKNNFEKLTNDKINISRPTKDSSDSFLVSINITTILKPLQIKMKDYDLFNKSIDSNTNTDLLKEINNYFDEYKTVTKFITNQTVKKFNRTDELGKNLQMVNKVMPFIEEIIIKSLNESRQSLSNIHKTTESYLRKNFTQDVYSNNTTVTPNIDFFQINTNQSNDIYERIRSMIIKSTDDTRDDTKKSDDCISNQTSPYKKSNFSIENNKNNSNLKESPAYILPIHLGTINIRPDNINSDVNNTLSKDIKSGINEAILQLLNKTKGIKRSPENIIYKKSKY